MRVLVTGACGTIGRALVAELEHTGHDLRLVDARDPEPSELGAVSQGMGGARRFDWPFYRADIMNLEQMGELARGIDVIVHLAGLLTGYADQGPETFRTNAHGTFVVLHAGVQAGIERFLCASSINAFGTLGWRISGRPPILPYLPLDDSILPEPEDPYSLSKYVNELTCEAFHRAYGIRTAALRFGWVWDDERYRQVLKTGLKPTEEWSIMLYSWVHVRDIATGIRRALESPNMPASGSYVLNALDTSAPEPTIQLIRAFAPDYEGRIRQPLDGRAALLSSAKAADTFGYAPQYRLDAAIVSNGAGQ